MSFETLERKAQENKMYIKIFNSKRQTKEFGIEYKELDQNDYIHDDSHLMSLIRKPKSYEIHWKENQTFNETSELLYVYQVLTSLYPFNF